MPQLTRFIRSEKGSVFVIVVAFSIVMAIAGTGIMLLSGNSVNHEAAAFENDRAFLAAESGLLLGKRWLADTANWNLCKNTGKTIIYAGIINGVNDTVSLLPPDAKGDLELRSEATGKELGFKKRLSWGIRKIVGTNPGVFINNLDPNQGGVGQGGLDNIWFDGPFHSNMPIYLSAVSNAGAKGAAVYFINGPVSVHNKIAQTHFADSGHWGEYGTGPSGNNYDFGILLKDGQSEGTYQGDKLDCHFQNTFLHSQDSLYMPPIVGQDILLPVSQSVNNRALLFFDTIMGTGTATYYYYDAAETRFDSTFEIDKKVIRAQNPVSVLGVVKGQTTVVTDFGYNIYPVGDLTYADFTPDLESRYLSYNDTANYGVGFIESGHTNLCALASGGDIHFEDGNKKLFNKTSETLYDAPNDVTMYVTACFIAIETDRGIMWDTKNMSGLAKDMLQNNFNYTLRVIGSRTIDHFFDYMCAGGTNSNTKMRFFLDSRVLQSFRAPGVPEFKSASTTGVKLFILKTDWREQNIPISL